MATPGRSIMTGLLIVNELEVTAVVSCEVFTVNVKLPAVDGLVTPAVILTNICAPAPI